MSGRGEVSFLYALRPGLFRREEMEEYTITPEFKTWLRKHRPEAAATLDQAHVTKGELTGGPGRHRLTFNTIKHPKVGWLAGFDRQVDTDKVCIVLDGRPDVVASSGQPAAGSRIKTMPDAGDTFYIDPVLVGPLVREDLGSARRAKVTVVDRQAFMVKLALEPKEFTIDVDELRCWASLAWIEP